jgi:tRNA/tmRNA/rRNA uracil-C5-methylase (TrmA/RlmC/RlmD family)
VPAINAVLQRRRARIADVGCGAGWSTIALARAYPSATVLGVDLDEPSIEAAQANAKVAGVADQARFTVAEAETLAALGRLMPSSPSNAFTTCHVPWRSWQRCATPSVQTVWL